jgi:hypothetical protein
MATWGARAQGAANRVGIFSGIVPEFHGLVRSCRGVCREFGARRLQDDDLERE